MIPLDYRFSFFHQNPIACLDAIPPDPEESTSIPDNEKEEADFLHFGSEWSKIEPYFQQGELFPMIAERREETSAQKALWRPFVEQEKNGTAKPFYDDLAATFATGKLKPHKGGGGGVYFLCDASGEPRYVVKPCDESIYCLNNPKQRGTPFNDISHRLRDPLPLYATSTTEAAVYALADEISVSSSTPETHMAIVSSPLFYDLSSNLFGEERERFISLCGGPDQEKLCSVQHYIPDSIDLKQAMHEWFEAGLEQSQPLPIDQNEYEDVLLLLWMIYDGDGHPSNFRLFLKALDDDHHAIYTLRKIDNGLALPEDNRYLLNYLGYLPNAQLPASSRMLEKIAQIDLARLCNLLDKYHLSHAKGALSDRVEVLKGLAKRPITLEEFNRRFELLNMPNGKDYALSPLGIDELLEILWNQNSYSTETTQPKNRHPQPKDHYSEELLLRA